MESFRENKVEKILREYEETKDLNKVQERLDIPMRLIKRELISRGGEKGKQILLEHLEKELPIKEIMIEYKKQTSKYTISRKYGIPRGTLSQKIYEYMTIMGEESLQEKLGSDEEKPQKKEESGNDEEKPQIKEELGNDEERSQEKQTLNTEEIVIDLSMIINYFRLGYNIPDIEKFAEQKGYQISQNDLEIAKKIESKELKVASENSIERIIEIYKYSYEEIARIGKEMGYVVLKERYDNAKRKYINNKKQKGEEK